MSNLSEATEIVTVALAAKRKAAEPLTSDAEKFHALGAKACAMGQLEKAHFCYSQALKIETSEGNSEMAAVTNNSLAVVRKQQGKYEEAIGYLTKCVSLREQVTCRILSSRPLIDALKEVMALIAGEMDIASCRCTAMTTRRWQSPGKI
jgi:tetratricopeptide (TPR) repeat protein